MTPFNKSSLTCDEKIHTSFKSEGLKLFALYFIANIFLFLNTDAIYWDDWSLFNHTHDDLVIMFTHVSSEVGYFIAHLHYQLLTIGNGVFSYRIATFLLLLLAGFFVYRILKTIKSLTNEDVFFITLFFLIAPVYSARIALIDFPYTFSYFVFFFAFYILSISASKRSLLLRIGSLGLFFLSFLTNSLLFFYAVPLMYLFYIRYHSLDTPFTAKIKLFIRQNIDFLLVPIVFFVVKTIYFAPNALYSDYNSLSFKGLINAPIYVIKAFFASFIQPVNASVSLLGIVTFLVLLYAVYVIRKRSQKEAVIIDKERNLSLWIYLGAVIFALGVFAYCAVGKLPEDAVWNSRHQLLVPLGFSFMLYFSILLIFQKLRLSHNLKIALLSTIAIAFIGKNLHDGYRYNLDWFYAVSIQENLKEMEIVQNNSTFVVDTTLEHVLANNRRIRTYEYNGMMRHVFKDDTRLMVTEESEIEGAQRRQPFRQYNYSAWQKSEPVYLSIIPNPRYELKRKHIIKLFYSRIFNNNEFRTHAKKLVLIHEIRK